MAGINPLVFVVIPFGTKRDVDTGLEIDFDAIYESAIRPAAGSLGLDVIRGDEEKTGGIIMRPVFERLLLAEIVVADLTMQNPNVFYELGVRHSARPQSTVLIYAENFRLPFDVAMVRAIPYELSDGKLDEVSAAELTDALKTRLKTAVEQGGLVDSPLSQLIPEFPYISLPHNVTESFRDRVAEINETRKKISLATRSHSEPEKLDRLLEIEHELGDLTDSNAELFADLLLAYRDTKSWDGMVRVSTLFPEHLRKKIPTIVEQRAFALNRRNNEGDRESALADLRELITEYGDNPETCGLVGRIYKDMYEDEADIKADNANLPAAILSLNQGRAKARGYLGEAIDWYRRGFAADPRDFYPGINEATLRFIRGDDEDFECLESLLPAVAFSVARLGGIDARDYWIVATVLELSVLREQWEGTDRMIEKMLALDPFDWMLETTSNNLILLRETRRARKVDFAHVDAIIAQI